MADLGSNVVVLEADEPRVPSEDEVKEYAAFLGIDVDNEPHLMWIAWEGVAAPVPPPWKACHNLDADNDDEIFYFNFETAESVWDHPCDEKYRQMVEQARADQAGEQGRRAEAPGAEGAPSSLGTGPLGLGGPEVILGDIEEADEESSSSSESPVAGKSAKKQPAAAQPKAAAKELVAAKEPVAAPAPADNGDSEEDDGPDVSSSSAAKLHLVAAQRAAAIDDGDSEEDGGPDASTSSAAKLQPVAAQRAAAHDGDSEDDGPDASTSSATEPPRKLQPLAAKGDAPGGAPRQLPPLKGVGGSLGPKPLDGGDAAAGGAAGAREHGLAGVGLAAAKGSEEPRENPTEQSAASESASKPQQSGKSGPNDSLASEISEDFPSESDALPGGASASAGRKGGDTLELSASASAAAAADDRPNRDAAPCAAEALSLEAQVDSLARCLSMLRDVRAKQREYLRLLHAGVA